MRCCDWRWRVAPCTGIGGVGWGGVRKKRRWATKRTRWNGMGEIAGDGEGGERSHGERISMNLMQRSVLVCAY